MKRYIVCGTYSRNPKRYNSTLIVGRVALLNVKGTIVRCVESSVPFIPSPPIWSRVTTVSITVELRIMVISPRFASSICSCRFMRPFLSFIQTLLLALEGLAYLHNVMYMFPRFWILGSAISMALCTSICAPFILQH